MQSESLVEQIRRKQYPGLGFGRVVQSLIAGEGDILAAGMYAREVFTKDLMVEASFGVAIRKGAVPAGTTADVDFGAALVPAYTIASEFTELMRPMTVLGRLAVRRVPFNTRFTRTTTGTSVGWLKEGAPSKVTRMDLLGLTLTPFKLTGISVITTELARNAQPSASATIAADLAAAAATFSDTSFLDPDRAAVANESPASVTHGAQQFTSSGNSFGNVVADLKAMMGYMVSNGIRLSECVFIMGEEVALAWAMLTNTNSDFAFEDLGPAGGTLFGLPVITSGALPLSNSPSESFVTLLHAPSIAVAEDPQVGISISTNASLQIDDAPATGAQAQTSLWENNLAGIRVLRFASWIRRRDKAVVVLRGINL